MTLSPWIIYLWGIADNASASLRGLGIGLLFASSLGSIGVALFSAAPSDILPETAVKCWIWIRRSLIAGLIFLITSALMPSSKTIAVMVVAPAIINSEPIQKDLPEIYQLAKDALKSTLKTD